MLKTAYLPERPTAFVIMNKSMPYICRIGDAPKSSMCIFEKRKDAQKVANAFEAFYMVHKEWPLVHDGKLELFSKPSDARILEVYEMEAEALSYTCVKYNLDACIVHDVEMTSKQIIVKYTTVESNPHVSMSISMLNDLWAQE